MSVRSPPTRNLSEQQGQLICDEPRGYAVSLGVTIVIKWMTTCGASLLLPYGLAICGSAHGTSGMDYSIASNHRHSRWFNERQSARLLR